MPNRPDLKFPKKFLWGVSTSAHQVEGGQHNQWSVWELENARALVAQAPYHYDDLDNWSDIKDQATSPRNYVSGKATDHYNRYEEDIKLITKLNMNAFRLSIEWSRIQPKADSWDAGEIEHYKEVLAVCKKQGIEPIVTLFHFTLPVWFSELGGFERAANVHYFVEFAERIMSEIGATVRYIITINEPEIYVKQSYVDGNWPPQRVNRRQAMLVRRNLVKAHNQTADKLHAASRRYKVSIAKNYSYIHPGDDAWLTVRASQMKQYQQNEAFLSRVIKRCDFIGVNFYFSNRMYGYRTHNADQNMSDVGWDMQPQYLARALTEINEKYNKPILITENGVADASDSVRKWWLTQTITALQSVLGKGVPVIGYLHWSLTDTFEWEKGFWPRFGLFAVNYKTMERTPRASALWLAQVIKKVRG